MRNSYSPSPTSSRKQSRSPTPRVSNYSPKSKHSPKKSSSFSEKSHNFSLHNLATAIIFFLIIVYISVISSLLNPPANFCNDKRKSFCRECPTGANCSDNNFTCIDESKVKFFEICHAPGNFFKTEDLSLLYHYQTLLYDFVEEHKGQATVNQAVNHFGNENLSINDIEIIWTYDRHYYIDDNGVLRFHSSPMFSVTLFTILFLFLFAIVYYIDKKYLA